MTRARSISSHSSPIRRTILNDSIATHLRTWRRFGLLTAAAAVFGASAMATDVTDETTLNTAISNVNSNTDNTINVIDSFSVDGTPAITTITPAANADVILRGSPGNQTITSEGASRIFDFSLSIDRTVNLTLQNMTLAGGSGGHGLQLVGGGATAVVNLHGDSSFVGDILLEYLTVNFASGDDLGAAANKVTINTTALLTATASTTVHQSIVGTSGGTIYFGASSGVVFELASTISVIGTKTVDFGSISSFPRGGTLILSGANTYTGTTIVGAGTLLINGSIAGPATVSGTGRLGGSGTIGGAVTLGATGTIAPGAAATGISTGTLTAGSLTWNSGGTLALELGTTSDLLALTGALNKGSAGNYNVVINDAGGFGGQSLYNLVTFASTTFTTSDLANFALTLPGGLMGTLALDGDSLDLLLGSGQIIQNGAPIGTPTNADFTVSGAVTTGPGDNTIRSLTFEPGSSLLLHSTLFVTQSPVNLVGGSSITLDGTLSASQFNVQPGAWLGGNGTIQGNVSNNGLVSPGNSPGTIRVSGNYTQSPAGTLRIEVGGRETNQFDRLLVGGRASLDGTLQLVRVNDFDLRRGDKITFLTAAGGVGGQFATVSNAFTSETILQPTVVYGAREVSLEVIRGSFANYASRWGLTPNQHAVATALDSVSADDLDHAALVHLDGRKLEDLPGDFDRIAPEELTSIFTISTALATVQSINVQRRTDDIRHGASGFSASGLAMQGSGPAYSGGFGTNAGAAGPTGDHRESKEMTTTWPSEENKWGAFLTGAGEWVDVSGDGNARGYDVTTGGFTLGLDYKVCANFVIGIAAGYAGTAADLTDDGRVWVNGGKLGIYATTYVGGWYADTAVSGGYNSYDTKRSALLGTARGSTDGGELNVLLGTGYDWKVGALTVGPTATFNYTRTALDGFTEHGSLSPLDFASRTAESVRSAFGFKASADWKCGGVIIRPEVRAAWQHEYGDRRYDLDASFAGGAGNRFLVNGPELGRDSLLLGAGVAVQCSKAVSTYLYYDGELGRSNYESHSVSGGIRIAF